MSQIQIPTSHDPELVHVLVNGECGHTFPVPVARLDGSEFSCPACGAVDHLDAEGLEAARAELARRGQSFKLTAHDASISELLGRSGQKDS